MIVVTNKHIPSFSKPKNKKDYLPIAQTDAGDVAYYTTNIRGSKKFTFMGEDEDLSDDESDDDEMFETTSKGMFFDKPKTSFTGADWQPVFNDRLTMFIAGAPGAGKSYLAKQMINLLPHDLPILLFTALEENDGNFDDLGKERLFKIKMEPKILSLITLQEIRNKAGTRQVILLFDDVDKIRNPQVQKHIFNIMNDALANGRGHEQHDGNGDIHVICTSHSLNDYLKTKYTLENSNYVALFPGHTPVLQMQTMFNKLGLSKELCAKLIKLGRMQKLRSIIIHRIVPLYLIFKNQIMLI